jgi:hypothetical protein
MNHLLSRRPPPSVSHTCCAAKAVGHLIVATTSGTLFHRVSDIECPAPENKDKVSKQTMGEGNENSRYETNISP